MRWKHLPVGIRRIFFSVTKVQEAPHLALGRLGEKLAAEYLTTLGYTLVARNFRLPSGRNFRGTIVHAEIDIIAYDQETLCFIEVKTRRSEHFASPEANVDLRKQRQIARASRVYRRLFPVDNLPFRYDVITILIPENITTPNINNVRIELLPGFWTEAKFRNKRWFEITMDY